MRLKAIASNSRFILGKCIYDTDLQKTIINEGLEYLLNKGQPGDRVDIKDYVAVRLIPLPQVSPYLAVGRRRPGCPARATCWLGRGFLAAA